MGSELGARLVKGGARRNTMKERSEAAIHVLFYKTSLLLLIMIFYSWKDNSMLKKKNSLIDNKDNWYDNCSYW